MLTIGRMAALAALAGGAGWTAVGGWAVVTVENPPETLNVGETYRIEFTVRQHGVRPLKDLEPSLRLRRGGAQPVVGASEMVRATPTSTTGRYSATFRVPETDRLTLTVKSGFGPSELTLLPIPVLRQGEAKVAVLPAERGRRLFVAKGCGSCHVNGDVPEFSRENRSYAAGPELTGRRLEATYVRARLTDPASLPPIGSGELRMPNLGLSADEVGALVALLTGPGPSAERGN